jgi:hypothetical protein
MITMNDFKAEPAELREAMLGAVSGYWIRVGMFWATNCSVSRSNGRPPVALSMASVSAMAWTRLKLLCAR